MNTLFPPRVLRKVTDAGLPQKVLNSPRYRDYAATLLAEVSIPASPSSVAFRGRWALRNSITKASSLGLDPTKSDIVIFYLHGGGYVSSTPTTYLLFLLRLAEVIELSGKTISVFALDYDLAPEARFPLQLHQARAAYNWLISDIGVTTDQLLLMGDSAGGHLALSLLVSFNHPIDSAGSPTSPSITDKPTQSIRSLPRPGLGLVLLSPWLSLSHRPESFSRNTLTDVLTPLFLYRTALRFLGPHFEPWPPCSPLLEFLSPSPSITWDSVLPDWVWVSAGQNEILYDDIIRWIVERGADCSGESRINGEIDRPEAHVYAWLKTAEPVVRRQFLEYKIGDEGEWRAYEAVDRIGRVISERLDTVGKAATAH